MTASKKFRIFIYYPIVLSIVLCGGILLGAILQPAQPGMEVLVNAGQGSENGRRIGNLLDYINEEYVDSVDVDNLTENAIFDLIDQLDPHSAYIPAKDLEAVNEPLEAEFDGIGVEFNIINDTIVVLGAVLGGPSEKLGIRSGDRIVTVDGDTVAGNGITNKEVISKLRGKRGTIVNVGIFRRGGIGLIPFSIERDKIPIYSVDAAFMLNQRIGYMRISRFAASTLDEYEDHMKDLKGEGMKGLVLDLRGNSGGYLQAAISLADEFLPNNDLIVYTRRRDGRQNTHYATRNGKWEDSPIAIIIDENSASASEIIAGAIQDNDRGTVIGRRSFGKGLVQEQVILPDGAAVRLTIARYYTPSGRCIQRPYENRDQYEMDVYHRYESGELYNRDSIKVDIEREFKTKQGRTVYGGGGIIPDVFIGMDTTENYRFYNAMLSKGLIREFALIMADKYRNDHQNPELMGFISDFKINEKDRTALIELAKRSDIDIPQDKEEFPYTEFQIKARAARNLFNGKGYYTVRTTKDEMVEAALNILDRDL